MQAQEGVPSEMEVRVDDIGGIDEAEFTFSSGVTVLAGRNATNRTSLLNAIAGGFGGSGATVRGGAETGSVAIDFDGSRYDRQYRRQEGETVAVGGSPYSEDVALVDTFVRLLRDNPIRRAVSRGEDLRDLLMRPVDTSAIEEQIAEVRRERREIESRLEEIDRERDRLPGLERRRDSLSAELEELSAERDELRERVEEIEMDRETAESADGLLTELDDRRQQLSEIRDRIDTQQASIEALEDEREDVRAELAELEDPDDATASEEELDRLRDRAQELSDSINDLSAIVEFNEDLLEGDQPSELRDDRDVTAALDPASTEIRCWTCGSEVERDAIDGRLDELRSVLDDKRAERREVREEIERLENEQERRRQRKARRNRLDSRLTEIEGEIERRESRIADFKGQIDDVRDEIQSIEEDLERTDALGEAAENVLDQYQRISELEYERGQVEGELADVREEIDRIEGLADERDRLEERRSELENDLTDLRTRVEDRERAVVETFNDHMEALLERLDYENIERVWIERRVAEDELEGTFDLHVVRQTSGGTAYEDSITTLSESEREVVGLVVALAGYLAHDIHERVPIMLLDSLEAIDADRIATLVEYLDDVVPYLVVALLSEDARAVPDTHNQISFGGS